MSRIAILTAALTMAVAPAALAGPADYRAPDSHTAERAAQTKVYDLRTPDAKDAIVRAAPTKVDLRSPDAADVFVPSGHSSSPSVSPQAKPSDGGFNWGILGIIVAGFAACGALVVMLRRHLDVGRPLGT